MSAIYQKVNPARVAILRKVKDAIRAGYAWPGGYPLSIICNDGGVLCPDCAKKDWRLIADDTLRGNRTGWEVAGAEVLYEGGNNCDQCGKLMDAYPADDEDGRLDEDDIRDDAEEDYGDED